MTEERQESLKKEISYCIENFDLNKATSRLIEFIKDEEAINYSHCYTTFAGRQQELLEFPEYIAKEHYTLVNQIGKIHYWKNETDAKTTVQLYNDFKANDL
jgi:hypothetical protein